jgi:hypothetical protein
MNTTYNKNFYMVFKINEPTIGVNNYSKNNKGQEYLQQLLLFFLPSVVETSLPFACLS